MASISQSSASKSMANDSMGATSGTDGEVKKVKKTRRRLRLSCVECTKRRQKCDRKYPCSLCVSRGVAHLCRWESVPVARPPPARPPSAALRRSESNDNDELIRALTTRIACLEKMLEQAGKKGSNGGVEHGNERGIGSSYANLRGASVESTGNVKTDNATSPASSTISGNTDASYSSTLTTSSTCSGKTAISGSSSTAYELSPSNTTISLNSSHEPRPLESQDDVSGKGMNFVLESESYDSISNLAAFTLGHHGEFVGRGTLICALHSLSNQSRPRFLYTNSTESTNYPHCGSKLAHQPYQRMGLADLIEHLPSAPIINYTLDVFFKEINWRYGIPEKWFQRACAQMLNFVHFPDSSHNCGLQVNLYFLQLLYSILAITPRFDLEDQSDMELEALNMGSGMKPRTDKQEKLCSGYFMCAVAAQRLAHDDHLDKPSVSLLSSAADGSVLGCLAIGLMCDFLGERGRVSEAWKLVGAGLRHAEAVGMHRDPDGQLWQVMSEEEKLLRRRAWWSLYVHDKLLSYLLGRPHMVRQEMFDVALPHHIEPNGRRIFFDTFLGYVTQLCDILGEVMDNCLYIEFPSRVMFMKMDDKFCQWEANLPPIYKPYPVVDDERDSKLFAGYSAEEVRTIKRQRFSMTTWYLISRVKLYLASITGLAKVSSQAYNEPELKERCAERCVRLACQVMDFQCSTYEWMIRLGKDRQEMWLGSIWYYEGCFALFEASVALVTILSKHPRPLFRSSTSCSPPLDEEEEGLTLDIKTVTKMLNWVMAIFSDVVRKEQGEDGQRGGKRGDTAALALDVLKVLTEEHWWKICSFHSSCKDNSEDEAFPDDSNMDVDEQLGLPSTSSSGRKRMPSEALDDLGSSYSPEVPLLVPRRQEPYTRLRMNEMGQGNRSDYGFLPAQTSPEMSTMYPMSSTQPLGTQRPSRGQQYAYPTLGNLLNHPSPTPYPVPPYQSANAGSVTVESTSGSAGGSPYNVSSLRGSGEMNVQRRNINESNIQQTEFQTGSLRSRNDSYPLASQSIQQHQYINQSSSPLSKLPSLPPLSQLNTHPHPQLRHLPPFPQ